jgi:N6-L-threonylcarbamoyladenine synthase
VGLSFAKGLSLGLGAPIIGVNHLHAHLLSPLLQGKMEFPALGLIVSGGHTQLVLMRSETSFELLGRTLDDAAGEAFDKLARALNFPYPGGRYIDELARESEPDKDMFPRPYIDNDNLDFSFSGLKTAAANHLRKSPELRAAGMSDPTELPHGEKRKELARLCASFNWSVAGSLRIKLKRALSTAGEVKTIVAAGGVAANSMIREMLSEVADEAGLAPALPEPWLCTDNAAMIALAGEVLLEHGLVHGPDVDAVPRGRDVPWDYLPYGGQVRA